MRKLPDRDILKDIAGSVFISAAVQWLPENFLQTKIYYFQWIIYYLRNYYWPWVIAQLEQFPFLSKS